MLILQLTARGLSPLLLLLFPLFLTAQLSENRPLQSDRFVLPPLTKSREMPSVNLAALQAEDAAEDRYDQPTRFAVPFSVDLGFKEGDWATLPNGDRVWRLRLRAPGARAMTVLYDDFHLPPGATLHLYNPANGERMGAFTERNNTESGRFATGILPGEITVLEYYEPLAQRGRGMIHLAQVGYAYRIFGTEKGLDDSGGCQVNVNCDEGADWQDEKRGVARIIIDGQFLCSGSLVNNTTQDGTPYFLTANHCIGSLDALGDVDAGGYVFYWDFERPGCDNTGEVPDHTTAGATLVANSEDSDFALFRLTESPNNFFLTYFNGWSTVDVSTRGGAGIHHPSGDAKKIATHDYQPESLDGFNNALDAFWSLFWMPTANGYSVTEGGSSGSPLFNADHHVIGQLFGGSSVNCSDPAQDVANYGKFAYSWLNNDNPEPGRRLSDWLDPDATGVTTLDGAYLDPPPPTVAFTGPRIIGPVIEDDNFVEELPGDCRTYRDIPIFIQATYTLPSDFTAGIVPSGDAVVGKDYDLFSAQLTLSPTKGRDTFTLRVYDDHDLDGDRQLTLLLTSLGGDIGVGTNNELSITLVDNERPITGNNSGSVLRADFNDLSVPSGWTVEDGGSSTDTWFVTADWRGGNSLDGTPFLVMDSDDIGAGNTVDEVLLSPVIDLATSSTIFLSFDHFFNAYTSGGGDETATVEVYDGNAWITVYALEEASDNVGSWEEPDQQLLDLVDYANASFQLRFRYTAGFDWWWALDNIELIADVPMVIVSTALTEPIERYLGPNALVPIIDPATGRVLAELENLSDTDHGCTTINLVRDGTNTTFPLYSDDPEQHVLSRAIRIEPSFEASSASYRLRYFMEEEELTSWSVATGAPLGSLGMLKLSDVELEEVSPTNFVQQNTDWQPILTGTVGEYTYAEATFTSGFSTFVLSRNPASTLPVEWLSVTGRSLGGKADELRWITAREENNAGFTVETATDGLAFRDLGRVVAGPNPDGEQSYTYVHSDPEAGSNLYRVRQTDVDGSVSYSAVISITTPGTEEKELGRVVVSPGRGGQLVVDVGAAASKLSVFDASGRLVLTQAITEGRLNIPLPANLSGGLYFVQFTGEKGESVTEKILAH